MTHTDFSKQRSVRKFGGRILAVIIALIVPATVMAGLYKWKETRNVRPGYHPSPVSVEAAVAKPCQVPRFIRTIGSLRSAQQVTLAPEVSGRVTKILFNAGSKVSGGDMLLKLYDAPLAAQQESAMAKLCFAKLQFKRSKNLAPTGAESKSILDQRRSERDQAKAALLKINAQLAQKQVKAPFSGQLGIRHVNLGQYLNPGDAVVTLTALDPLYIDFTVPQQDFSSLTPGAGVSVYVDAWPDQVFCARVSVVEPIIDKETRNIMVQAVLANPDEKLRPGMHANVHLNLPPQKNVLVVPDTAVMTSATGRSIMVVRGKDPKVSGQAEQVAVTTGRQTGDNVIITAGLVPGDVFLTNGQVKVRPGAMVKVESLVKPEDK